MTDTSEKPDAGDASVEEQSDEKARLALEVTIESPSTCERHVSVVIPRDDIERYYDDAIGELMPMASVPGFRAGRAPRPLVQKRFREQLTDQVKGSLLLDSMTQVTEESDFAAISEPDFDFEAVELPEDGPMSFEFDVEVRPEFDLPDWKGLKLDRRVKKIEEKDVDLQLEQLLDEHSSLAPHAGKAELNDYVVLNITFRRDGEVISTIEEETVRVKPRLSFPDGNLTDFGKLVIGAKAGDKRETTTDIVSDAPVESLQGQQVDVELEVLDVKRRELPEIDEQILDRLGFETVEELRKVIREIYQRRIQYYQDQHIREQITSKLVETANWELPPELLRKQTSRELQRAVLELRSSGFSESEIRTHENDLRQNSMATTAKALKEHFILERIADELSVEPLEEDFEQEFQRIAEQTGESVRRVRARIEKKGMSDAIRNQITERKVLAVIAEHAKFKDVPFEPEGSDEVAVDTPICGMVTSEIPEAKYADKASGGIQQPVDRS